MFVKTQWRLLMTYDILGYVRLVAILFSIVARGTNVVTSSWQLDQYKLNLWIVTFSHSIIDHPATISYENFNESIIP